MVNKMEELLKYFEELKTIEKVRIDKSKFINVEAYSCKLNNGKSITREKVLKNGSDGSAAIVLPITKDNKIILAIEPRVFTFKTVDIGLPAGYIEEGEDSLSAAKRELLEETGYVSSDFKFLGSFYQDQGCSAALNYYFVAFNCKKKYDQKLDESEFVHYIEVSFKELEWLIENGYIMGLNSIYTIERSRCYLKER